MTPRIVISILVAACLAITILSSRPQLQAGNLNVVTKTFDLTQGYQIPAAGDTVATGPTSTPANGAITLAATAGARTACAYSRIIDVSAPLQSRPETTSGPASGVCGMDLWASQASATLNVSVTALYGVASSTVTTPVDLSSTSATGTMSFYGGGQADAKAIQWFTNHVPRNSKYVRFLITNNGGVAVVIPAGKWNYASP